MAYTPRKTWVDNTNPPGQLPSPGATPILASDLAYIENGIVQAHALTEKVTPLGGGADDTAQINAAAASAATSGGVLSLSGTFTIAGTVGISCNLDARAAVFNYTGSGVCVDIRPVAAAPLQVLFNRTIDLPRVVQTTKPAAPGWKASDVGVRCVNVNGCIITVPEVKDFATGLEVRGEAQGSVYCTFLIGALDNNKRNMYLSADTTGWSNQNTYVGGRYSHNSGEGTNVSGVRQVLMQTGLANAINNNTWLNASVEGNIAEYTLEVAGTNNMFLNPRFEVTGGAKVWWRADATGNQILYGYNPGGLIETRQTGALRNHVLTVNDWHVAFSGSAAKPGLVWENTASSSLPIEVIMEAGAEAAGTARDTGYAVQRTAMTTKMKRATDAHERLQFDHQNGKVGFGIGTAAVAMHLQPFGAGFIGVAGAHFTPTSNNTADLGITGFAWRDVRAARVVQTGSGATGSRPTASTAGVGASFFDTTLNKPIWSTGSAWVDATGTTV